MSREIIFNPVRYWFTKGPLTKLFRTFLWSSMPPAAKFGILGYLFSYYALTFSWWITIFNYIMIGVFQIEDTFCKSTIFFWWTDTQTSPPGRSRSSVSSCSLA